MNLSLNNNKLGDIKAFLDFAESLKLVRKTRIEDFINDKNVDDIYTDLLPNNGIINKLNLPRTTILVGRKGTGKSTIFQKSQKDLISNKKCVSIYIDVKSLYDNSAPILPEGLEVLASGELHKYLIYSNLIKEIVLETKNRLDDFVKESILQKILGFEYEKVQKIKGELEDIEDSIIEVIKKVDVSLITSYKNTQESSLKIDDKIALKISQTPELNIETGTSSNGSLKKEFESTLVSYLDIKNSLINNLTRIKEVLSIDHLYIFLDDYSEIEEEAQRIFMDWFIAPLNNLSNDFVKFKIAVYPNRFYYGKLDNSKIDEISLDFFDAFYTFEKKADISKMETLALDYTTRLIKKRLNLFFPNNNWERFFSINEKELCDLLFSVSFNNPRKIGYILSYCYESCLIHDEKISFEAIENASLRYYNDVTIKYFLANQYVSKPFNDKISNEHQFDLLLNIIERQKINGSNSFRTKIQGKPTNHFTINHSLAYLLNNLELNGFVTTYNNIQDKSDKLSTVFSLDYGLCKRYNLCFRRASNEKLIKYFSLPRFNMNVLVTDYFNKTQIIKCTNGHEFPFAMLENLKKYKMKCPECLDNEIISKCEITISSTEIMESIRELQKANYRNTSFEEFIILDYLKTVDKPLPITKISSALDKSELTITNNINKLVEKGHIIHDLEASKKLRKEHYLLSDTGNGFVSSILNIMSERLNKKIPDHQLGVKRRSTVVSN